MPSPSALIRIYNYVHFTHWAGPISSASTVSVTCLGELVIAKISSFIMSFNMLGWCDIRGTTRQIFFPRFLA